MDQDVESRFQTISYYLDLPLESMFDLPSLNHPPSFSLSFINMPFKFVMEPTLFKHPRRLNFVHTTFASLDRANHKLYLQYQPSSSVNL